MPIEFVTVPEKRFASLVLPDPERRPLRFLFMYDGDWRAMSWLQIGADGTLYLNRRRKPAGPPIRGIGVADGKGGLDDVRWAEEDKAPGANPKISHHASGIVTAGSTRSKSVNIREIDKPTLFRQEEYSHPSRFAAIRPAEMRETDITLPWFDGQPYELHDDRPLTSRVFAGPLRDGHADVPMIDDDPNARAGQVAVLVPAKNLKGCQDIVYQVVFFNRQSGKWPAMDWTATLSVDH